MSKDYQKILIINLGGIGDVLLSTPALRALRQRYQHAHMVMLTSSQAFPIAAGLPYFERVEVLKIRSGFGSRVFDGCKNAITLAHLRMEHFDLAVNMRTMHSEQSARKMLFLLRSINARSTAGRDTEGRGSFFAIRIPETDIGKKHEMEYDIDLARALGAQVVDRRIHYSIEPCAQERVDAFLRAHQGVSGSALIGIHPGGAPNRRWPLEYFVESARSIARRIPACFILTGNKYETALVRELACNLPAQVVNTAGNMTVNELGALLRRCHVFVTNDTGPMHIAAAVGVPVVALFGPGDLMRFDPRAVCPQAIVLRGSADCAPCLKRYCDTQECLRTITPAHVTEAVCSIVHNKS